MRLRTPGVRLYLLLAMMALAVGSVAITGLLIHRNVAAELERADVAAQRRSSPTSSCGRWSRPGCSPAGSRCCSHLPLALHLSRPLRRLNELAARMAGGRPVSPGVAIGGGRELGRAGRDAGAPRGHAAAAGRDAPGDGRRRHARAARRAVRRRGPRGGRAGRRHATRRSRCGRSRRTGGGWAAWSTTCACSSEAQRPALLISTESVDLAAIVRGRLSAFAQRFRLASIALEQRLERGVRGRRSRAPRAGRRQPPAQRAALHRAGWPRDRLRAPCGGRGRVRGDRHGHRHLAGAPRPHLRPLLARAGGRRARHRGDRRRARDRARPRAGPSRPRRGPQPLGQGIDASGSTCRPTCARRATRRCPRADRARPPAPEPAVWALRGDIDIANAAEHPA